MNIKDFKEGDIITRNEPCQYEYNGIKDGSYLGDKIKLLGVDEKSKIIFYVHEEGMLKSEMNSLSYARDRWDEGWEYYPKSFIEGLKKKFKIK